MGVIYKLRDEVVHFIISERQSNPLFSCRQLAESASQRFGLNLSKSSVHDVLKESGIVTPRGRKPKNKFQIPQEKKKQIQNSLSQVKLLPAPVDDQSEHREILVVKEEIPILKDVVDHREEKGFEVSPEYEGAGNIFLKAVLWDLGIPLPELNEVDFPVMREMDWKYYLTYCKGVRIFLENDESIFIDLPLPIERCIREVADGLINNVKPLIIDKVSDEVRFKACMEGQAGSRIYRIDIVDQNDHTLLELTNIIECNRAYLLENRIFVENFEKSLFGRAKGMFFPQSIDINNLIESILNLKGFDRANKGDNVINLIIPDAYDNELVLEEAMERFNRMFFRDDQNRLVKVKRALC